MNLVRVPLYLCCVTVFALLAALLAGCGDPVEELLGRARAGEEQARYELGSLLWERGEQVEGLAWAWASGRLSEFMRDHETGVLAGALDRMVELRGKYGPPLTPWETDRIEIQRNASRVYAIAAKQRETNRVTQVEGYPGWSYSVVREKSSGSPDDRSFQRKVRVSYRGELVMDLEETVAE